jgi:hypothetical protein
VSALGGNADDLGFELLPVEDGEQVPAEDALNAAVASALEDPGTPAAADDPVEPTGYTWDFDWEAGRFKRFGSAPARVVGLDALAQRCMMAINSARYAHPVFSDEFGVEQPQRGIGTTGREAFEAADDWRVAIRDALLVMEDVSDVQVSPEYDPVEGVIVLRDLVVVTNEEVELSFDDIRIDPDVEG